MKTIFKRLIVAIALVFMLIADVPFLLEQDIPIPFKQNVQTLFEQLVPEAHAIFGVRRRTRRRTAVVAYSAGAASASAAAASQQAATAQQQAATTAPAPSTTAAGQPLPLGTVVSALPGGCTSEAVGGVEYYHCGSNYFRAVFQGNNLVYVTAKP